jgi:hypothetical protein
MQLRSHTRLATSNADAKRCEEQEEGTDTQTKGVMRWTTRAKDDVRTRHAADIENHHTAAASSAGSVATSLSAFTIQSPPLRGQPSPDMRLPLSLMPSDEIPSSRYVQTDVGLLHLHVVNVDPLIVRCQSFLTRTEISTLLDVTSRQINGSAATSGAKLTGLVTPSKWARYEPYLIHKGADGVSDIATMHRCYLKPLTELHPLLATIAARIANVCQSALPLVSTMREILRYEVGQEFKLHKDDKESPTPPRGRRLLTTLIYLAIDERESGHATTAQQDVQVSAVL